MITSILEYLSESSVQELWGCPFVEALIEVPCSKRLKVTGGLMSYWNKNGFQTSTTNNGKTLEFRETVQWEGGKCLTAIH